MRCLDPPGHWRSSRVLRLPVTGAIASVPAGLGEAPSVLSPGQPGSGEVRATALNARSRAEARSQVSRASRAGRPGLHARGSLALPCFLALALLDPEPARPGRPAPPLSLSGRRKVSSSQTPGPSGRGAESIRARALPHPGELGDAGVVDAVDAGLECARAAAGVAGRKPTVLGRVDRAVARAPGLLVEQRHAAVLGGKDRIGADGPLDRAARIPAVEARNRRRAADDPGLLDDAGIGLAGRARRRNLALHRRGPGRLDAG